MHFVLQVNSFNLTRSVELFNDGAAAAADDAAVFIALQFDFHSKFSRLCAFRSVMRGNIAALMQIYLNSYTSWACVCF